MASTPTSRDSWSYGSFGEPDVLKRGSVPLPPVGPTDVLVRVKAAALNPVDLYLLRGTFGANTAKFPVVPGKDFAGEVTAVGSEVTDFRPGASVYGATFTGAVSEYTVVDASKLSAVPKGWSFLEAASLPIALGTAQGAFEAAGLKAGQSVIITAGAGGVGVYAIQLAKALGVSRIVATASKEKHALLKDLGATEVVDYRTEDFEHKYGAEFDVALDSTRESAKLLKVVKPGSGKVVTITDFSAPPPVIPFALNQQGSKQVELQTLLETRAIKPVLDPSAPYKFDDAPTAYKFLATKKATGKIVVEGV